MTKDNIIEVENLTKRYPLLRGYREFLLHPFKERYITALDDVSFEVKKNEIVCLVGPNGSGKTTLIKILSTIVIPTSGKAIVDGYDVKKYPERVKQSIGYVVSEERSFYWRLTGRENLNFFAVLNNLTQSQTKKRVNEVLELLNITEEADNAFNTYSTGIKYRFSLARALLTNAKILFLDEPTKSLDPMIADEMWHFLLKLVKDENKTIVFTSHNLQEAEEFSNNIIVLDKGKIAAQGSPEVLKQAKTCDSLKEVFRSCLKN